MPYHELLLLSSSTEYRLPTGTALSSNDSSGDAPHQCWLWYIPGRGQHS